MKFSTMRKDTLIRFVQEKNLPIPNPAKMRVGNLRERVEELFPEYLELWFLERFRQRIRAYHPSILLPDRNRTHLPGSDLEFDFSWKSLRLAVEIQGGIDSKGRKSGHVSPEGMRRDMRKVNLAQLHGWFLIQLAPEHINTEDGWLQYTEPLLVSAISMCQEKLP